MKMTHYPKSAGATAAAIVLFGAAGAWLAWAPSGRAAQPSAQGALPAELLPAPAGENTGQPNLSVDTAGNVLLVWSERAPQAPTTIRFSRFDGRSWTPPRRIVSARGIVGSAADIPSIMRLPSGRLVAHWLQTAAGNTAGYGVRVSHSVDDGATWSEPLVPHTGHETGENGFVSMYAASGDSAGIIWLDGRQFARGAPAASRQTMLLGARVAAGGGLSAHTILDERACECCHTSVAATSRGPVVVYRDRSPDEIRDISLVQLTQSGWSAPRTVNSDGWFTRSCPVNGPAVAAFGNEVAVAWFTAARDSAKVLLTFSSAGVTRFSAPVRVDVGEAMGRVSVVMTAANTAWVSWVERHPQLNSQLRLRRVNANGSMSTPYTLAISDPTHTTGFPRMVHRRGELILAWSTAAATGVRPSVRVARVAVAGK